MPALVWVGSQGAVSHSGKLYRFRISTLGQSTDQKVEIPLPTGLSVVPAQGSSNTYRNRVYTVNIGTDNVVIDEHLRCHRQGILAPTEVPILAASGTGVTGSAIVAISFWDELTNERSPLSGTSNTVALSNQGRSTSGIPTTCADPRVTHVELWVSVDGADFRLSTRRQLGVSTIVENVATLALGEAAPDTFTRLPRATMNALYHDRQFVAGNALHPDILYCSEQLYPERYGSLSFRTRNGDPITALIPCRDVLLVLTSTACYALAGYTEDDMSMQLVNAELGAFNHSGCTLIHGDAWIPNAKGFFLYNGAFHQMLSARLAEWIDSYKSNQAAFERGFTIHDPIENCVMFWAPTSLAAGLPAPAVTLNTTVWVADYTASVPELSGSLSQPEWSVDHMARETVCAALLSIPGAKRADPYFGFADGYARGWSSTNSDDDSDTYNKLMILQTGHLSWNEVGGDVQEGQTITRAWTHLVSESSAWILYIKGGDEYAHLQHTPDNSRFWWKDSVAASFGGTTIGVDSDGCATITTYTAKTVHMHLPQKVTGRGFIFQWTITAPAPSVRWMGFGVVVGPGPASRPMIYTVNCPPV